MPFRPLGEDWVSSVGAEAFPQARSGLTPAHSPAPAHLGDGGWCLNGTLHHQWGILALCGVLPWALISFTLGGPLQGHKNLGMWGAELQSSDGGHNPHYHFPPGTIPDALGMALAGGTGLSS